MNFLKRFIQKKKEEKEQKKSEVYYPYEKPIFWITGAISLLCGFLLGNYLYNLKV